MFRVFQPDYPPLNHQHSQTFPSPVAPCPDFLLA